MHGASYRKGQATTDSHDGGQKKRKLSERSVSPSLLPLPWRRLQTCCCHGNSGEREGVRQPIRTRAALCCITSGGGRAGNTPTVPRLGFTVAVRQSTLPPAGPECQTVVIRTGFKGRPCSPSGQSQRGRLCARSVTQSSSSTALRMVGSCGCPGIGTANPSCDWTSCSTCRAAACGPRC